MSGVDVPGWIGSSAIPQTRPAPASVAPVACRDPRSATDISAEHLAFCPDNIFQGADTISAYAPVLVGSPRWDFWWD